MSANPERLELQAVIEAADLDQLRRIVGTVGLEIVKSKLAVLRESAMSGDKARLDRAAVDYAEERKRWERWFEWAGRVDYEH